MSFKEYRNPRGQLHRAGGPAIETNDRKEWWVEGRRHRDDGPAVDTIHGTKWFFWRGVRVPEQVILRPREMKPGDILQDANAEVRRARMEAYGLDDFIIALNPKVLDHNKEKDLMLLRVEVPNDEALVMVRVKNSTPEGRWSGDEFFPELKDGKPYFKHYMIRVDPKCTTAEEAVAWTFNMTKEQYAPAVES